MRITFIRPNLAERRSRDAMEPLCFAILRGLTPPDVETVLHDERLAPIPFDEPTDLVALTVETYTARRAYDIAARYRARGVRVVMGGYHPTLLPEEALRHADAIALGDAEGTWGRIVAHARAGRLDRCYRDDGQGPLADLPVDRRVYRGKRYAPVAMVQYGRGCRYQCEFCSIRAFYGADLRQRPVRDVVRELEPLAGRHVFFVDDNLFVSVPKAKELLEALVPLRITWSSQISIDVTRYPDLMRLLERSGCTTAVVGFESLDAANLAQMRKAWNLRHGTYAEAIARLRDAGVMLYGTFVLGYDHDTAESCDAAAEFAIHHRFYLANFNPLTPMPGTPLLERLRREGRMIHDTWWLDPSYRYGTATFRPRGMTADELTEGCYRARTRFNTYASIAGRLMDPRTHLRSPRRLAIYLLSNLVSRREIHAKQGLRLGGAAATAACP